MAMIFDSFPNVAEATMFVEEVITQHGLTCTVFADVHKAQEADPFPGALAEPIVHVERSDERDIEESVEGMVNAFGGRFAGT